MHGFANQVPLAVALRQILPPGYGFSADPDVDLGVLVSFQGGKPWRQTLSDALAPAGLVMHEKSNQMVGISEAGATAPVEAAATPIQTPPPAANASTAGAVRYLSPPATAVASPAATYPSAQSAPSPSLTAADWRAERGDTLHNVIQAWANRAHVELNWLAEYDYPIQASFNYSGSFEDAVRAILTGFENAHPQPIAELHDNPSLGQRVLVVQTRGNNYSD